MQKYNISESNFSIIDNPIGEPSIYTPIEYFSYNDLRNKLKGGLDKQVLTKSGDTDYSFIWADSVGGVSGATNGLNLNNGLIKLGGDLIDNTTITTTSGTTLTILGWPIQYGNDYTGLTNLSLVHKAYVTGLTSNLVDLATNQIIGGEKTFTNTTSFNSNSTDQIRIYNAAGNNYTSIVSLASNPRSVQLPNVSGTLIVGLASSGRIVFGSGTNTVGHSGNLTFSNGNTLLTTPLLNLSGLAGGGDRLLSIDNSGAVSATTNIVDLTTDQTITAAKVFAGNDKIILDNGGTGKYLFRSAGAAGDRYVTFPNGGGHYIVAGVSSSIPQHRILVASNSSGIHGGYANFTYESNRLTTPNLTISNLNGTGNRALVVNSTGVVSSTINEFQVVPTATTVNNNAVADTLMDAEGYSFPMVAGKTYSFNMVVPVETTNTTNGSRLAFNGSTFSYFFAYGRVPSSTTAATTAFISGYNQGVMSSNSPLQYICTFDGCIKPTADGIFQLRFSSEVASAPITVHAGGKISYTVLD